MEEIQKNDTFQEPVSDNSAEVSQTKEGQAENAPSIVPISIALAVPKA